MNKLFPAAVSIACILLSCLMVSMGGYFVADTDVWTAFLKVLLFDQWPQDFVVKLLNEIRNPYWESLYDRFAFLQVNDPLLI